MKKLLLALSLLLLASCGSNIPYSKDIQTTPGTGLHRVVLRAAGEADPRVLLLAMRREAQYFCELGLSNRAQILHWDVWHHPEDNETVAKAWFRCVGTYP